MSAAAPKTFRQSLSVALALAAVVPLLAVSVVILAYFTRHTTGDIEARNLMLARAVGGQVESFLREPRAVLRNLRGMLQASPDLDGKAIERMLDAHVSGSELFESIYMLDPAGRVRFVGLPRGRAGLREDFRGISLAHKDFVHRAKTSPGATWSETFLSLISGRMSLALCLAIDQRVLVGNFNIDILSGFVQKINVGDRMSVTVIDRDGAVIVHPDPVVAARKVSVGHLDLVRAALEGTDGTGQYRLGKGGYLGSAVAIRAPGWVALVSQTTRDAYHPITYAGGIFAAGVVGAILLAVSYAVVRARRFAGPLAEFAAQTQVIAKGRYELSLAEPEFVEVKNLAGNFRAMVGAVQDRENELRKSRERYRQLVEKMPDGMGVLDAEGVVTYANPSLCAMLGLPLKDLVGRKGSFFFDDENQAILRDHLARRKRGESGMYEIEWTRQDGTKVQTVMSGQALFDDGTFTGSFAVVRDVSEKRKAEEERRQLEEQLLQARKMESIGRLAGGVAHDFNNILSSVLGYCELALLKVRDDDPVAHDLRIVQKSGERAAELTRQLLAFSRKQVLQKKVVDLNVLVGDMTKMLGRLIRDDIELSLDLQASRAYVPADPGQVEQVVMNLVVNARDAMPDGGRILIETAGVDLDEAYAREHEGSLPGRHIMIAVSDTGEGMTEEVRSQIFEPFFTTKAVGSGTGLGLATLYGIVKQHRGSVHVYSEPGHGTTFKVYLPAAEETHEGETEAEAPEPRGGKERVLIVDDDDAIRFLLRETMERHGYRCAVASRGQEAVDLVDDSEDGFDLLITDVIMPGMSGMELADALRSRNPGLKVIYMSGYTGAAVAKHGVLEPGVVFVQKPITPRALAGKVREVLEA